MPWPLILVHNFVGQGKKTSPKIKIIAERRRRNTSASKEEVLLMKRLVLTHNKFIFHIKVRIGHSGLFTQSVKNS